MPQSTAGPSAVSTGLAGIGRRMAMGAAWTVAMRLSVRGIGLVSTVILARVLAPADFGLIAMASLVSGFLMSLSDFNFRVVLIREQHATRDYYDTAWTLSLIRGVCMAGVIALLAAPAAVFFAEPRVTHIVYVLALTALIQAAANIGVVDFEKELRFHKDYQLTVVVKLGSFIVTVALAVALQSYWALVVGVVVGAVLRLVLSYRMHPFRPRLDLSRWREILGFSAWVLLIGNLTYLGRQLDVFFIGRLLGTSTLGLYTVAMEIGALTTTELVAPIRRALLPGYAKLNEDSIALQQSFVDSFALILLLAIPAALGIGLLADPLVRVFLGNKWLGAIPVLQVAIFAGLMRAGAANAIPLLFARGQARRIAFITAITLATAALLLFVCINRWGAVGGAVAMAGATAAGLFLYLRSAMSELSISAWTMLRAAWRSLFAAGVMSVLVMLIVQARSDPHSMTQNVVVLIVAVMIGATCYTATHLLLWRVCGQPHGAERHVLDAVARIRVRVRSPRHIDS